MKIQVKVKPNSKQQKIEQSEDGTWIIRLKSPPVDGKANQELINLLAKHFQVGKKQITIKAGLSAKNKLIEIDD
ncbi:MAG: DUF167 domain-containing protein [Xenococcaceae cyanobacterium MO_188.B29]|nr:DUF167 domain-containing protein [Xenococcaceae cyanobacterium MO_188.B29]